MHEAVLTLRTKMADSEAEPLCHVPLVPVLCPPPEHSLGIAQYLYSTVVSETRAPLLSVYGSGVVWGSRDGWCESCMDGTDPTVPSAGGHVW